MLVFAMLISQLLGAVSFLSAQNADIFLLRPSDKPENTHFRTLAGESMALSDFQGRVLVLVYWATWCGACRTELKILGALQNKYAKKVCVLAINADSGDIQDGKVQGFLREMKYALPVTRVSLGTFPPSGGVPAIVIVDSAGWIRRTHVGTVHAEELEAELRALMGLPTGKNLIEVQQVGDSLTAAFPPSLKEEFQHLSLSARRLAWKRLNSEPCPCGCNLSVSRCLLEDSSCSTSIHAGRKLLQEVQTHDKHRTVPQPRK